MKQHFFACLSACGVAASAFATEPPPTGVPSAAEARQQVLALGTEWVAAEVKHDAATLQRILDDKFVASFGGGKPYDKAAFIKAITGSPPDPTASQTLTDETVIVDGDTAVVVGTDTARGTENGVLTTEVARYTVTYVRRNGRWLVLAEHMAQVPPAK